MKTYMKTYHRLTREVVNPKPDGRKQNWTCQPTWPAGMLVAIHQDAVDLELLESAVKYSAMMRHLEHCRTMEIRRTTIISRPNKYGEAFGYSSRGKALFETLATALEPLPGGNNDMVLAWLLETSTELALKVLTVRSIKRAVKALNAMDDDEWNALRKRHLL